LPYAPLHVHSEYSLLDSTIRIRALARRCRELGLPACALTDHANLHGAVEFHDACLEEGIRPILGCELYVAPGSRLDRSGGPGAADASHHLIVLAKDAQGWANVMRLSTRGYREGFHYRPRVDRELLAAHSGGLVCLSGCLSGKVASLILKGHEAEARLAALELREIFGAGNFFLEVQDHGLPEQIRVNAALAQMSRETGIPLVATPDAHYLRREDAAAHDVLLCIQTSSTLEDRARLRFPSDRFHLKDDAEMRELFAWAPDAVDRTLELAAECRFRLPKAALKLPEFALPPGVLDPLDHLRALCRAALPERYPHSPAAVEERLEHELRIVGRLGYAGYFLIVADFVAAARRMGVPVGPGRGSVGGSLVAYLLGITRIEPLAKGLLFERFLNPDRVSPPDIDVDFADTGREKVIAYVVGKYGRDRVAQIAAFGRLAARAAVRDVGRAFAYSASEVDALAKRVPPEPDITLERALEESAELRAAAAEPRAARLLETARALEGLARHLSTHAAGIVIGKGPLEEDTPLLSPGGGDAAWVTQFDMASLERTGLVKMDFLGLRALSVLDEARRMVLEETGAAPDLDRLPDGDPAVFEQLSQGDSHGVFQLESWGMRELLKRFKPRNVEDLDQLIALFRPGPMRMIDEYLRRRDRLSPVLYDPPALEPILRTTCGVIVYQEQVMRVAMDLAGFTASEADLLRRAMGKKDPELLEARRKDFVEGCSARGIPAEKADGLFDQLARFAEYGYNKAHSAAYAALAYQTAWMKTHHPAAFFAALLSSELGSPERVQAGLAEARKAGVAILGPDVNASGARFRLERGALRFGLAAVRHVGETAMDHLATRRENGGAFTGLEDLLARCDAMLLNLKAAEQLIKAGALDSLGGGPACRAALLADLPSAFDRAARSRAERVSGQGSLFGEAPAADGEAESPKAAAWSEGVRLAHEREALGFFLSGHPLDRYSSALKALRCAPVESLGRRQDASPVVLGGMVTGVRLLHTKRGEAFARLEVECPDGVCEVLVWPRTLELCRGLAVKDALVLVRGRVDRGGGEEVKVAAEELTALEEALRRARILHVRLAPARAESLLAWAKARPGSTALWIHVPEERGMVVQKASLGVALDADALTELKGLGIDCWAE